MFKILLKHYIYELCIDIFFDNIKSNFFPPQEFRVIRNRDIPEIMRLFKKGHRTIDVIVWYARLININSRDNRYEVMIEEILALYSKHVGGHWDQLLTTESLHKKEVIQDLAATGELSPPPPQSYGTHTMGSSGIGAAIGGFHS